MMNEKRQFKVKTASGYFCLLCSISRQPCVLICPWKPHKVVIASMLTARYSNFYARFHFRVS